MKLNIRNLIVDLEELKNNDDLDNEVQRITRSVEFKDNPYGILYTLKTEKNYLIRQIGEGYIGTKELSIIGLILSLFTFSTSIMLNIFIKMGMNDMSILYVGVTALLIIILFVSASKNKKNLYVDNNNIKKLEYLEYSIEKLLI